MLNKELKAKINSSKIVSFDIFDTLVYRPFWNPEDLFLYIEKKYKIDNFYKNRIKAAEIAYANILNGEDTTLDNIYNIFANIIGNSEEAAKIKDIEMQEELSMCYRNKTAYSIYKYALSKNKQIIFTSDMYLPQNIINDILTKTGYYTYNKLFVSSTYRKLKKTGSLFNLVLDDLNITPKEILHIGDNFVSDYTVPKSLGIKAYHLQKCQDIYKNSNFYRADYIKDITISNYLFNCAFNFNKYKKMGYWYKFGYEIAGLICVNYVKWIIQKTNNTNCEDLIFIARDGYLLEKIYNTLTKNKNNTYYLYAPRSINLLCQLNYEKDGDFTYEHTKTIIDYYRTKSKNIKLLPEIKTKEDGIKYINENYEEIKALADIEYKRFTEYIESNLKQAKNIAIVDSVSKFFSAQKIIEKCINKQLYGLYYLIQEGALLSNICVESYSPITKYQPEDYLIEFIMSSDEPPILSISEGQVLYKTLNKEESTRIQAFKEITKGVLDFVDDLINTKHNVSIDFVAPSGAITDFINSFIKNPTYCDKKHFKNVLFAYDTQHSYYMPLYPEWYGFRTNLFKKISSNINLRKIIILFKILYW